MNKFLHKLKFLILKKITNASISYNLQFNRELIRKNFLIVGENTYGLENVTIKAFTGNDINIKIGRFCSIADNCTLISGGIHPTSWISTYPISERYIDPGFETKGMPTSKGPICLKNDVWIASNVTILSGVSIGNGAIICSGAVVNKDIPDYSIAGGVPAKIIKYRFTENQITELLRIKWWNWNYEKIRDNQKLLSSENIEEFLNQHRIK